MELFDIYTALVFGGCLQCIHSIQKQTGVSTLYLSYNCHCLSRPENTRWNEAAGDFVDVSINLRGREWIKDGKEMFFNTLQAWRIQKLEGAQPQAVDAKIEDTNDLPF